MSDRIYLWIALGAFLLSVSGVVWHEYKWHKRKVEKVIERYE